MYLSFKDFIPPAVVFLCGFLELFGGGAPGVRSGVLQWCSWWCLAMHCSGFTQFNITVGFAVVHCGGAPGVRPQFMQGGCLRDALLALREHSWRTHACFKRVPFLSCQTRESR